MNSKSEILVPVVTKTHSPIVRVLLILQQSQIYLLGLHSCIKLVSTKIYFNFQAQCTSILEKISHQVNSQHSELAAHRLLSIFKMAEVQIVWPEVNGCRKENNFPILSVLVFIVFPIVRMLLCHTEFTHRTKQ